MFIRGADDGQPYLISKNFSSLLPVSFWRSFVFLRQTFERLLYNKICWKYHTILQVEEKRNSLKLICFCRQIASQWQRNGFGG